MTIAETIILCLLVGFCGGALFVFFIYAEKDYWRKFKKENKSLDKPK